MEVSMRGVCVGGAILLCSTVALAQQMAPRVVLGYSYAPFDRACSSWIKVQIPDDVRAEAERRAPEFQAAWDHVAPSYFAAVKKIAHKPFRQREFYGTMTVCRTGLSMSHPFLIFTRPYLVADQIRATGPLSLAQFSQTVLHELLHWYADDYATTTTSAILRKYESELDQTKAHLHVHALMEGVFRDVLGQPEVIEAIKKANQDSEPYRRAWEIVDTEGHERLIAEIRDAQIVKR